ncbi:MAG: N-acetyltransferase family protein [Merdibacter sp.]
MQIRVAGWEDLADIYAIYCPYVRETSVSFETKEPSFAQFRRRFASVTADYPWLVAVDGETVIGYAYASRAFERAAYDWCCDLAIYFRMESAHHGMASVLYEALMDMLRLQNVRIVYALVTGRTCAASFHERMAFQRADCLHACGYKLEMARCLWLEKERTQQSRPLFCHGTWRRSGGGRLARQIRKGKEKNRWKYGKR